MTMKLLAAVAALAAATASGCATSPTSAYTGRAPLPAGAACYDCGTVLQIQSTGSRAPNATGAVIGAVVGAAAAREIAKDQTDSKGRQNSATVAGAVGGAVAGNAIQNRVDVVYAIQVRMDDGRVVTVSQNDLGAIREGSQVRVINGRAYLR